MSCRRSPLCVNVMGDVMGDAVPEPVFAALMAEIEFARTPNAALGDVNVMHARIAAD